MVFDSETKATIWEYTGTPKYTFNCPLFSGAQRLWSGNTLYSEGQWSRLSEVTKKCDIVWEYIPPLSVADTSKPQK